MPWHSTRWQELERVFRHRLDQGYRLLPLYAFADEFEPTVYWVSREEHHRLVIQYWFLYAVSGLPAGVGGLGKVDYLPRQIQ